MVKVVLEAKNENVKGGCMKIIKYKDKIIIKKCMLLLALYHVY